MDIRKPALGCLGVIVFLIIVFAHVGGGPDDPFELLAGLQSVDRFNVFIQRYNPSHSVLIEARPRYWDANHLMFGSVAVVVRDDFYYAPRLARLRMAEFLYDHWCGECPGRTFRSIRFVDSSGNSIGEMDNSGLRDFSP